VLQGSVEAGMSDKGTCSRCDGCGQIASSDDGEPWTMWLELPPGSDLAVRMGIVYPLPCPKCSATPEAIEGGEHE
jgi:hypothetical protein